MRARRGIRGSEVCYEIMGFSAMGVFLVVLVQQGRLKECGRLEEREKRGEAFQEE